MSKEIQHFNTRPAPENLINNETNQLRFFSYRMTEPFSRSEPIVFASPGYTTGILNHSDDANYLRYDNFNRVSKIADARLNMLRELYDNKDKPQEAIIPTSQPKK
ncbi:MAG: hypothetical protein KIH89_001295 [Candidatus Shapirobacteria bacterium]|nr:hypothetical protein [Candidatus Shapirobacteria bacterium]